MKKFKMFFDIEKEEQWLNEQLQKGYRCTNISGLGIYTFEKTDKKYVMRLDYQDYLSKKKFEDYREIYEDFGWSYINGLGGLELDIGKKKMMIKMKSSRIANQRVIIIKD